MLTTVYLDDNAFLEADKIENEFLKGDLPPEFVLRETSIPKQSPHRQFCISGLVAHLLCELADAFGDRLMAWRLRREPLTRRLTS